MHLFQEPVILVTQWTDHVQSHIDEEPPSFFTGEFYKYSPEVVVTQPTAER